MRSSIRLAVIFLALAPITAVPAEDAAEMPEWMTGTWASREADNWADEYWTSPRAGIMMGSSRSGEGDKLQFWEHMRIVREADGQLAFWAMAGDQIPVRFVAMPKTGKKIVFENADHDDPQRIRYWREGKELKAQISLIDGSKPSDFSFKMVDK